MTLAIVCSGQRLQHRATFALTGDAPGAADPFLHPHPQLGGLQDGGGRPHLSGAPLL